MNTVTAAVLTATKPVTADTEQNGRPISLTRPNPTHYFPRSCDNI